MKRKSILVLLALALSLLLLLPSAGCGTRTGTEAPGTKTVEKDPQYVPVFTDPAKKIEETSSRGFAEGLFEEAVAYEPLLEKPGTQVSMGFWSARGNHGSLVRVLDSINDPSSSTSELASKAIWDEGATSQNQYPSYLTMLEEHWYERSSPGNGRVTIYGKEYSDPKPVTFEQADQIWGQYSQRYADMARLIKKATGKTVKVWCFVQGAKENRIFYKYELPELRELERSGDVQVFFAKIQDSDWTKPEDWVEGTANAPKPVPAQ